MKNNKLDDIDKKIISLLIEDGRMSFTKIAEDLTESLNISISHVSVQKRFKRLKKDFLKIQANSNINHLNYQTAYVIIETKDYESERRLIERARLCPRIYHVDRLTGKFNLILHLISPSMNGINCFITSVIKSEDRIRNYEIFMGDSNILPRYVPLSINFLSNNKKKPPCGMNCLYCGMYKDGTCKGCPATSFQDKVYADFFSEKE